MLPSELTTPQVTILTPTWNRRHLLPRLYDSLVAQQVPHGSFEWLVVDDGSTDGTSDWLSTLIPGAPFPIRMIRQENGGKHRALNRGAKLLETPWVVVVDSDDWLLPGGLKIISETIARVHDDTRISTILTPHTFPGGHRVEFRCEDRSISFAEWIHGQPWSDVSHAFRTTVLKENPFVEFAGETYIAETSLHATLFRDGGIYLSNESYTFAEYQPQGLSRRSLRLRMRSPLGAMYTYRSHLNAGIRGIKRLRTSVNYHRFYLHAVRLYGFSLPSDFRAGIALSLIASPLFVRDLFS